MHFQILRRDGAEIRGRKDSILTHRDLSIGGLRSVKVLLGADILRVRRLGPLSEVRAPLAHPWRTLERAGVCTESRGRSAPAAPIFAEQPASSILFVAFSGISQLPPETYLVALRLIYFCVSRLHLLGL